MRRAAKVDANQAQIVSGLRRRHVSVLSLAAIGQGVPDLLCAFRGVLYLFEVKDGSKPKSARKLTADQTDFHAKWLGSRIHVVTSLDECLQVLGLPT